MTILSIMSISRSGGPLGLSIIGGSDHSCIPFGTGEQVSPHPSLFYWLVFLSFLLNSLVLVFVIITIFIIVSMIIITTI